MHTCFSLDPSVFWLCGRGWSLWHLEVPGTVGWLRAWLLLHLTSFCSCALHHLFLPQASNLGLMDLQRWDDWGREKGYFSLEVFLYLLCECSLTGTAVWDANYSCPSCNLSELSAVLTLFMVVIQPVPGCHWLGQTEQVVTYISQCTWTHHQYSNLGSLSVSGLSTIIHSLRRPARVDQALGCVQARAWSTLLGPLPLIGLLLPVQSTHRVVYKMSFVRASGKLFPRVSKYISLWTWCIDFWQSFNKKRLF